MWGLGVSKCRCGGTRSCRSARTTLMRPATPAAASRWPMFVLTEPTTSGSLAGRSAPSTRAERLQLDRIAERRCRCRAPRRSRPRAAPRPAAASASRITASWAGPFGAVRPLLRPSWLTAVPRITARTRSPSASASARRLSTTTPQPSPRTKPSARASKSCSARPAPSSAARDRSIVTSGAITRFTPPASAIRLSPARRL